VEAIMMLCDFAESLNGKLYIQGGGWDRVMKIQPLNFAVAIMLEVPWHAANEKHRLNLTLQTEDGQLVPDAEGNPIQMQGEFETGRPAGVRPGTALKSPFAARLAGLDLDPGAYAFVLEIDGTEITRSTFTVEVPPPGAIFGGPTP
jgi:hypothetical protein